jgi:hypothetical protein
MKHSANQWLTQEEISQRDERIAQALACIEGLEQRFSVGIYPPRFATILSPGISRNVFIEGKHVFGLEWLDKKLKYVEEQLLDQLAKEVLKDFEVRPRNDPMLRGSSWRIAQKLCVSRFADPYLYREEPDDGFEFDCDVEGLTFGLHDLMCEVQERLDKHHMTYRLWDAEALEQLEHYLFYSVRESELYFESALSTGVYGRPANVKEFLAGVAEAIAELPVRDLTECTFPDDYPEQVRFTDYVPPQNMTAEQIELLYLNYLKWYEED